MKAAQLMVCVALVFCGPLALADAIEPEKEGCPPGTGGDSCHGGQFCYPLRCKGGCKDGKTCVERRLCMSQIDCVGGWDTTPDPHDSVTGTCEKSSKCKQGTCKKVRVCVHASAKGTREQPGAQGVIVVRNKKVVHNKKVPPGNRGCCSYAATDASALPILLLLGLTFLIRRRHGA